MAHSAFVCFVGNSFCDELITRPEESHRVCLSNCALSVCIIHKNRRPRPELGLTMCRAAPLISLWFDSVYKCNFTAIPYIFLPFSYSLRFFLYLFYLFYSLVVFLLSFFTRFLSSRSIQATQQTYAVLSVLTQGVCCYRPLVAGRFAVLSKHLFPMQWKMENNVIFVNSWPNTTHIVNVY
jgi:hypothetical protein